MGMTQWQVTYPNTWRQNIVIYPLSVLLLAICAVLVVMLFVEAEMGRGK